MLKDKNKPLVWKIILLKDSLRIYFVCPPQPLSCQGGSYLYLRKFFTDSCNLYTSYICPKVLKHLVTDVAQMHNNVR